MQRMRQKYVDRIILVIVCEQRAFLLPGKLHSTGFMSWHGLDRHCNDGMEGADMEVV